MRRGATSLPCRVRQAYSTQSSNMEIWGTDGSTLDGIDNVVSDSIDVVASGNTVCVAV